MSRATPESRLASGSGGDLDFLTEKVSDRMVGQEMTNSCGSACMRQLLKDRGIDVPEAVTREASLFEPETGTNAGDVGRGMNMLDPEGGWVGGGVDPAALPRIPTPFIARVKPGKTPHNVIVDKVTDDYVQVRDPWGPQAKASPESPGPGVGIEGNVTLDSFLEAWRRGIHNVVFKKPGT